MSDREEGEIVDDDFEDISDNSIIEPCRTPAGKSVSPKDNLRDLSLSSLTDFEEKREPHVQKCSHRRPSKTKPKQNRKRKRSYRRPARAPEHSDSDGEDYRELDRRLQKQLKAAVHVSGEEDAHKNSLRTRLRAFTNTPLDEPEEQKQDLLENTIVTAPLELNKISDSVKESNDDDTELMQLRLEALRTAVVNKFKDRKKRKVASVSADESDTNKENANKSNIDENKKTSVDKLMEENKKIPAGDKVADSATTENKNDETTQDDDEDILRAHLLASMSKKLLTMTTKSIGETPKTVTTSNLIVNNHVKSNIPQKIVNNIKSNNNFKVVNKNKIVRNNVNNNKVLAVPQVKPFIIRVSADSDSEDDILNNKTVNEEPEIIIKSGLDTVNKNYATIFAVESLSKNTEVSNNFGIESTVDKFLREQRAKVEAEFKIDGALNGIQTPLKVVNNVLAKQQRSPPVMEKSAVKLLPKSKQIEYQKLLLRIKNAEKRPRIRKNSHRMLETKVVSNVTKTKLLNKSKVTVSKLVNAKLDKSQDRRTEALLLHNTLKDMQEVVDQRLQIRDRYKVLRPLIKHVSEASKERRRHDQEVKRLLEELAEAKKRQTESQQAFTTCVNKLVSEKEVIDKRSSTPIPTIVSTKNHFTSTPIRETVSVTSLEISSIPESSIGMSLENTISLQKMCESYPDNVNFGEPIISVDEPKMSDSQPDVNIGDPNDIDRIISKEKSILIEIPKTSERTRSFLKYISPLDIVKSSETSDPFSILCPFEVDGTCKDNECTYKHFLKR